MSVVYIDAESFVKEWLKATPAVASLVPLPRNLGPAIFLAMPKIAPNPVILCSMITGGPASRKDLPEQASRMSFDVIAPTRDLARTITLALIELFENTQRGVLPLWSDGVTSLLNVQTLSTRWLPDPDSDTPRYVVDALITTVT